MLSSKVSLAACLGLAAVAAFVGRAPADVFYGITRGGTLTQFDMTAQTVTVIGSLQVGPMSPTGFEDLAFDGAGNLYAVQGEVGSGFPPPPANNKTYLVDPTDASALLQGDMGTTGLLHSSLAYRELNGSFYSVRNINGHLGVLDVTSGGFTPVTGTPHGVRNYVEALAVDPTTGMAYSLVNLGSPPPFGTDNFGILASDLDAGTSVTVGSFGIGTDPARALRFDSAGVAYTVNFNTGDVYTVDVSTGGATFLFAGGANAVGTTGLALVVPAPGMLGLALVGGAIAARRRR